MTTQNFVSNAVVEKVQHLLNLVNLHSQQIFNCVHIKFVPFQFQAFPNNTFLSSLKHLSVQQVIYLFVVKLHKGHINRHLSITFDSLYLLHQLGGAPLDNAYCPLLYSLVNLRLKLALSILDVLVALHSVCLPSPSLAIRKHSSMITVDNLADHTTDPNLVKKVLLSYVTITYFIKLKCLHFFVLEVVLQVHYISFTVEVHLPRGVIDGSLVWNSFSLQKRPHTDYHPNLVQQLSICFLIRLLLSSVALDTRCPIYTLACLAGSIT